MDNRGVLSDRIRAAFDGCYEARRAAALSGVPLSTVYRWARLGIVEPSVSPTKIKLWSYADLMALRVVYWLRHPKQVQDGEIAASLRSGARRAVVDAVDAVDVAEWRASHEVRRSPMSDVRRALAELEHRRLDIWDDDAGEPDSPLRVDQAGKICLQVDGVAETGAQMALPGTLDLLGPFECGQQRGPDLLRPRPRLRIIPGKMSGEPHLAGSRITTQVAAALYERIPDAQRIAALYGDLDAGWFEEAIEFEHSLAA